MTKLARPMAGGSSGNASGGWTPIDKLTDDLLVEVFSRVPYKSLCSSTCVSRRWCDLIANPDNRRKLPQTLAGFFYDPPRLSFVDVSGTTDPPIFAPSLAFLPDQELGRLVLVDGCNGLLLLRCFRFADPYEFDYLVVNPATESWVALPVSRWCSNKVGVVRLGFDPATSSHFHVFEFQLDRLETGDENGYSDEDDDCDGHVLGVRIYSSEKRAWIHKQSKWGFDVILTNDFNSIFMKGMLYVVLELEIGVVDVEGEIWRFIEFPSGNCSPFFYTAPERIDLSQGQLHFTMVVGNNNDKLAIWVLDDPQSEKWTLKHTVSFKQLVGKQYIEFGYCELVAVALHPDRNIIFFVFGDDKTLMSYDMDSGKVCSISNLVPRPNEDYCISYVPFFSESLAHGQQ